MQPCKEPARTDVQKAAVSAVEASRMGEAAGSLLPTPTAYGPIKYIEYGFGFIMILPPYTPHSIYLRGTIDCQARS